MERAPIVLVPGFWLGAWASDEVADRLTVPTTVICTGFTSAQYREGVQEGYAFLAGLADLHDLADVDLPTGHWPMWSRPDDLADLLGGLARGV